MATSSQAAAEPGLLHSGTARDGVPQGCPVGLTLFGIFFDTLDAQLQAKSAAAGVERCGARVPSLFYADDVQRRSVANYRFQLPAFSLACSITGFPLDNFTSCGPNSIGRLLHGG